MADTQYTIVSLRELNTKLIVEITELKEKYAKVEAEKAELEIKNTELLKQIMKENNKHKADHTKLKEDTTNLKTKNTELEAENAFSTEEILSTLSDTSNFNEFNNVPNSN
ncbi:4019_t:CDS:2, partial [Ambispora gerdemannii]